MKRMWWRRGRGNELHIILKIHRSYIFKTSMGVFPFFSVLHFFFLSFSFSVVFRHSLQLSLPSWVQIGAFQNVCARFQVIQLPCKVTQLLILRPNVSSINSILLEFVFHKPYNPCRFFLSDELALLFRSRQAGVRFFFVVVEINDNKNE